MTPEKAVKDLEELKKFYNPNSCSLVVKDERGKEEKPLKMENFSASFDEAISFMQNHEPMRPLAWNVELALAAGSHTKALTKSWFGAGSNFNARLKNFIPNLGNKLCGENVSTAWKDFKNTPGKYLVLRMILCDGERNKGDRDNIMSNKFNSIGINSEKDRSVTIIDFSAM